MAGDFRVIDTGIRDGRRQIAFDQAMIDAHKAGKIPDSIRFLRFPPTALIGRHQALSREINLDYCHANGIGVVRRITGGGAIYFDEGQLGWELVFHRSTLGVGSLAELTRSICEAAAAGLSRLGVNAKYRPRNDIEVAGRKLSGTGGFFDEDTLFFQGTVLVDMNPADMLAALNVPQAKLARRSLDSAARRIVTLKELLGVAPAIESIREALLAGFAGQLGVTAVPGEITVFEESLAAQFHDEEIGTEAFVAQIDDPAADGNTLSASHTSAGSRFDDLCHRIQRELDDGNLGAAQVAVGLHGEIALSRSFGAAADDSRFLIYSATKPLVAMALLPHMADGSLDLTDPVARHLPEFGHHGKADVTLLQLLTMQGGFPQAEMDPARWDTSEGRRSQFAEWTLAWPAGTRTEYHPMSAHFVIAELIEMFTGRSYLDVVHERVVAPAGVPRLLGPEVGEALTVSAIGRYPADDAAGLADTFGRPDLVPTETVGADALLLMNDRGVQLLGVPGGGGIASAAHMAAVYQHLLHNHGGVLPADWLADATGTIRNVSINASDGVPANRTIAGIVAGSDGYHLHRWFPPAPRAFGHTGAGGQLTWADPASGLSFAFLHDTLHQDPRVDFRRAAALNHLAMALVAS